MNAKVIWTIIIVAALVAVIAWAVDVDISGDAELPEVTADVTGGEMPEVNVTGDFEMPDVDADVSGGEMPDVDVDTIDVEVREERATMEVPTDINVETEEETFTYPTVDVESPEEDTQAEDDDLDPDDDEDARENQINANQPRELR